MDFWFKAGGIENRNGKEPFFELLNFSDCEGTLPYRECKRLKKDFDYWSPFFHQKSDKEQVFWSKLFNNNLDEETWKHWLEIFDLFHKAINDAVENKGYVMFT